MANLKYDPKSEPEQRARRVLDQHSPILYTYATSPIRSLAIYSHSHSETPLIYVGTLSGTVSLLSVNPNTEALILLKTLTIVNGAPVISINIIQSLQKILILAGNSLFLLDSDFREPFKKLAFIKGGVTATAKRFKSRNYSSSVDWFLHKPNGVKKVSEVGSGGDDEQDDCVFAVGVGRKLVIVKVNSKGDLVILRDIQGGLEGVVGVIVSLVWVDDSVIVGSKSGYYLYSFVNGHCGLICLLPEGCTVPRVKLLRNERKVLLVVDNVGVIVDAEGQPVDGSLVFRGVPEAVGVVGLYVVVARDGKVEVYHKKSGSSVQVFKLGIEGGSGPCIMADEEDATANLVAIATGTKVICYKKVAVEEQIKDLLRKKSFKEALSLVEELESEGELSKEILSFVHAQVGYLLLFDLHFEDAVHHFMLSETMQPSEVFPFIMRDPNRWSLLVPRNRYWGLHPPPAPLENVVDDGLRAIERAIFLKKAGLDTAVDDDFILNRPSRADLMESAIKSMTRYLEASRDKDLIPSVREGVDTLLMYLYRALNRVADMERLASSENLCIVEELESLLNESGHLRTLAFLYASKGMNSKALVIWRLLARNYASSGQEGSTREHGLQDASRNVFVMEAARILEESSDQGLVLQHLGWIADVNQLLAVQVLISDKRANMLPPDEIIAAIDPKKVEILQRYLQWLIEDQGSDDTRFHTTYALLLAKSTLETYEIGHASRNSEAGAQSEINCSGLGRNAIFDTPVRERLQIFLQSSDLYDPEEVLDLIEGSELWLEKAILYRKLGQETLVLQILALKLEDCEAAEHYCAEIGRPDAYMQLLEMYLDPEFGKEPMFKAAVRLLHNHGESLDPLQVLERLSPDMPLHLASETILRMLRARLHHYRQGQIVHNLSRALDVDASLARLDERSRHVVINDESVCDSCHSRLGTKLFAMYPDDTVVCYKCFRRQGESTSVTGRDFKEDILYKPGWLVTR